MATEVRCGDVVLATFPFTDLSSTKLRPALVVSVSDREGPDFILAFITSKASNPSLRDVLIDLLIGRLGILADPIMEKVDAALKSALALH